MATGRINFATKDGASNDLITSSFMFLPLGPIWTGDNIANWDHLKASIPMVLSISIAGISFAGGKIDHVRRTFKNIVL